MIWVQNPYETWQYFGIDIASKRIVATIEHTNEGYEEEDRFWAAWIYPEYRSSDDDDIHVGDFDSLEEAKAAVNKEFDDRTKLDQVGKVE
jgi:hypothetical protein